MAFVASEEVRRIRSRASRAEQRVARSEDIAEAPGGMLHGAQHMNDRPALCGAPVLRVWDMAWPSVGGDWCRDCLRLGGHG